MTPETIERQIRGACPLDCPDTCSWIVTVKNGEPAALRGDPAHPYTRGALCNKVTDYLTYARSPDRLLYPMRRTGRKGSGQFTRISWDEALETITAELSGTIAKHGAEAIWPYVGAGNMGLIQGIYGAGRRLWNVLGTWFTVVVEHFMTDTARYADIVLPATMAIEHRDLLIAYGHLYLAWNEPAAVPPGECLPATEMFRRLARAMGLDVPALYDSDESIAQQLLDSGHSSLAGITFEELKARGWMRLNYPDPFVPFAAGFPTQSGKLEFVSDRMAQYGLDAVAGYTPAHETSQLDTALAREYPLALITPANHYSLNSIFANVTRQERRSGAATLLIHPDDAASRQITAGDEVRVGDARGAFFAIADVSDRIRPGVVASTKGRSPVDSKQGATVNATVDERDSYLGDGAVYHDNRVRVDRAGMDFS